MEWAVPFGVPRLDAGGSPTAAAVPYKPERLVIVIKAAWSGNSPWNPTLNQF